MADFDPSDIAIVGMALRVPGASTPEEYWANLSAGVEALRRYTDEELAARGVSASTLADPNYVKAGMPLQGLDQFDPEFFGFSPKEAAILDPQHRQFYEVAWEALERAGHPPKAFDGNIGIFAGCGMGGYFAFNLLSNPDLVESVGLFLLRHTGNDKDFLATRVSYAFDLKGPSVNVQTACSTSLVATHMAMQSLLTRETDLALAGGVTIEMPHGRGYHYQEGEILSPDGHCRTFDHRSRGTVFGSGAGVVVLRRLEDAIAAGDHIHAIIKGSAVNNDGSTKVGYLAPSIDGQAAAIAEALAVAGVGADTVTYVECHGTATPIGDPIEIAALTQAFRASSTGVGYCRVGSVKSNIGHLDTAAGVAGLIKVALALEHRQIPPSLHFEKPNPTIGFEGSPFVVADRLADWQSEGPRRAGVNSLGVGGSNAFLVLQEPPPVPPRPPEVGPQMLVLSARNRRALDDSSARLAKWLRAHPEQSLADVSYTLLDGRQGFEHRRVLGASSHEEAAALLESQDAQRVFNHTLEVQDASVVFMYPGGGAQYFQMSRGLYATEAVFREHVDRGLATLKSRFDVDLAPVFFAEDDTREQTLERLTKPSVQLPLTFTIGYALTKLWQHHGVEPAAVVGHSLGENTAACVAGVFSFEDALGLALLRGQLMDEAPEGAMLSVNLPAGELLLHLGSDLDLAAVNSPQLSVASGPVALIDQLAARLKAQGIDSQRVRIDIAAHSRLLDGILGRFEHYLRGIRLNEPTLPIISNRTGKWLEPWRARDPAYWVEHLRNTVLFADGVTTLLEAPDRVFLEVGPGNTLGSFVRQAPQAPAQRVFASLRHPQDPTPDPVHFKTVVARLWAVGVHVATGRLWRSRPMRVPLPSYAFQHASYWIEPGIGRAVDGKADMRPQRLPELDQWFSAPRWVQQGIVDLDETPKTWLVFRGREPIADALVERLRALGHAVVTVQAGDTFAPLDANAYALAPEAGGSGYQELIEALKASDRLPDRVLHTWLLTWDRSFRPGSSFFHRNQEYGFYSLLHLAQAFGKAGVSERKVHVIVAANGMQRIRTESAPYPDKATVLGPCAVMAREFPNITCRFVDVEIPEAAKARRRVPSSSQRAAPAIEALEAEAFARPTTEVVAWRQGVRWRRFVGAWRDRGPTAATPRLRQRGVYLLTGGLGGIAGVIAEWLAREYRARLVLVARTPLPKREDWDEWIAQNGAGDGTSRSIERMRMLQSLGAEVLALDADVAVLERMQEVVVAAREAFGEIDGVFHAAGVIRDNLIQLKSQRDIEEVFSAKVYGTAVLDELFAKSALDFMILFSSTSSFIAPQGQVDYVGANAFLNAFADASRGARPYPVIAVNWGVWRGVGMVEGTTTARREDVALQAHLQRGTRHDSPYSHFDRVLASRDGLQHVHLFDGTLCAERDWIVDEHRLANGDALLPGTGYLEIIRAALAEAAQLDRWQITNLVFLGPLFVRNGEPRPFRVRLREDDARWEIDVLARKLGAKADDAWDLCATARATRDPVALATIRLEDIEARCNESQVGTGGAGALRTRQEDHLRFGPRWRVLRRLSLGQGEALAHLQLAEAFSADTAQYGLHPGLLDIATGCAMDLIPGYAAHEVAQNLWAPISYKAFRYHSPLTAELVSWLRVTPDSSVAAGFAAFDVVVCDRHGNVLAEADQLTLRRIEGELRIPELRDDLPSATEVASAPEPNRGKRASPAQVALAHNVTQGIDARSGVRALAKLLDAASPPSTLIVSSMDLDALTRQAESISAEASASTETRFSRPQLESEFEAPRDDVEKVLAEIWGQLLGVEGVGIRDNFFDLGGHSLIAVRLFNEIADRFGADLPLSVLIQSPTIAGLGEIVRTQTGADLGEVAEGGARADDSKAGRAMQHRFVVPMHAGPVADRTPIFIVAGMFGNVLNLSHMAHLLGEERPFYALQARGLYGDAKPHESFEEAARDYIEEIRKIQPSGPYILGGFSGGGIAAYEIARQLVAAGEQIRQVIMLDTPLRQNRHFSVLDRASMSWQGFNAGGWRYLTRKVRERITWEKEQRARRREQRAAAPVDPLQFQSRRIGDAFLRSLARYRVVKSDLRIDLFRPKLDVRFRLSGGRRVDSQRNYVAEDNHWAPYSEKLHVHVVPGNHDSMVLEPNVRVLVSLIRRAIREAEGGAEPPPRVAVSSRCDTRSRAAPPRRRDTIGSPMHAE